MPTEKTLSNNDKPEENIRIKQGAAAVNIAVIFISILSLTGWIFDIKSLTSIQEDYIPIAPSTAICFLLLGLIVLFHIFKKLEGRKATIAAVIAILVAIFGFMEVVEFFTGLSLNFEDVLFAQPGTLNGVPLARMSPSTGVVFLLAGAAISLNLLTPILSKSKLTNSRLVWIFNGLVALIGLLFTASYLFGAPLLYDGETIPMALPTAFSFLLLGIALLLQYSIINKPVLLMEQQDI